MTMYNILYEMALYGIFGTTAICLAILAWNKISEHRKTKAEKRDKYLDFINRGL